jgi:DNA polymerase-3 subunit beta
LVYLPNLVINMDGTFTASQKELLTLLSSVQPICNKRTTLDVTESILFHVTSRELILKSTDLEISLQSSMAIESDFTEGKGFLISGKRIFELVKELDGMIQFNLLDSQIRLKANGVDLALNIKDINEFPQFPERIENLMNVDAAFLLEMLNKVAFLIPQNNANQALNGMLVELDQNAMAMVATDGHSLARVTSSKYTGLRKKMVNAKTRRHGTEKTARSLPRRPYLYWYLWQPVSIFRQKL